MRFRSQRDRELDYDEAVDGVEAEELRVQDWQLQRLGRLGYDYDEASMLVTAAWRDGDHTDLVHRIEQLTDRGATLDQAARIVVPVAHANADGDRGRGRGGEDDAF
jgi:hypothetical protein